MLHKRKSPAFSFYPDSWFLGTSNLSAAQEGIYIRLLCLQWSNGAFSVEQAFDHSKRSASETDIKAVLDAKFKLVDGLYLNERLESERSIQKSRVENAKKAGKKSGESRLKNKASAKLNERQANEQPNENGTPPATQSPTENEHSVSDSVSVSITNSESVSVSPSQGEREGDLKFQFANKIEIPSTLDTPEFREAWSDWIGWYFAKSGTRLDAITAKHQLLDLSHRGVDKSIRDLRTTMAGARTAGTIWDSDKDKSGSQSKPPKRFK